MNDYLYHKQKLCRNKELKKIGEIEEDLEKRKNIAN